MREAEDYIGDPIHALLFDMTSSSTVRRRTRALRREELFHLLNTYSLMYGEELGLFDEVADAKNYLLGDDTITVHTTDDAVGSAEASPVASNIALSSSDSSIPRIGSTTDLILEKFSIPSMRQSISQSAPPPGKIEIIHCIITSSGSYLIVSKNIFLNG